MHALLDQILLIYFQHGSRDAVKSVQAVGATVKDATAVLVELF